MSETTFETAAQAERETAVCRKRAGITLVAAVVSVVLTAALLTVVLLGSGAATSESRGAAQSVAMMDKYDMFMTNEISNALDGVLSIKKVYWLSDSDLVAPEPDPACYGQASSPAELMWLLEEAAELIDGQEMLFNENTPVWPGDKIYYYYDESILVITWKEVKETSVFTVSEVKVAHPSQFRRFLADGQYGSDKQYTTTQMSANVNAVVASSGDFYKFRQYGTIVYEGQVQRFEGHNVDTCFIDDNGDLLFSYRDAFQSQADAEKFVEENNIRFSLAFGPVLVNDGQACDVSGYILGEVNKQYSRAALCQMDKLHYVLVNSNAEGSYVEGQTIKSFAKHLADMGIQKAYALDGGQTTVIAMNDEMISNVDYGTQRQISDIIYFATAMPEGE